jgi:spore coat polysaccharide biosynthesis protein SpsF
MPKTIACIIARTGSSRLPKKVLKKVTEDHSMIGYIIERVKMAKLVDEIYICTTQEKEDDLLEETASDYGVNIYRGSTDEVIERFMGVGRLTEADYLIRITGDNVFTSYEYLDQEIEFIIREDLDYVRLINVPLGATAEVMSYEA